MNIGIDARLIEETGVGRYIQNLIKELGRIDTIHHYVVFLRKKSFDTFILPNDRWQKRFADVPWHTVSEQIVMPWLLSKERLDLVHIPYHNPSIFYSGKMVITIHDLTILHFNTGKATTLPSPFYALKRLGYRLELAVGLWRAKKIIAVSNETRREIIDNFHINPEKIVVTYEGAEKDSGEGKRLIHEPYVLAVGNAYPHKNLETVLKAYRSIAGPKLVLVGDDDFFYKRLRQEVVRLKLFDRVIFFGQADKEQLHSLYTHARALVFPSLMEGFGLPGIEAMALGTPVVCSDIPVFQEIYGDAALMFDPISPKDIADKLRLIFSNEKLRSELIARGKKQAAHYSWRRMALETYNVYEDCNRL